MKKNWLKNTALIVGGLVVLYALFAIIGFLPVPGFLKHHEDSFAKSVKVINDYQVKLYVYGEDFEAPEGLVYEKLEQLNSSSIDKFADAAHSYLIIKDLSGNMELDSEEIAFVRHLIYEKHVPCLYFGSTYLTTWDDAYMTPSYSDRGVGYQYQFGNILHITGFWTSTEEAIYKEDKAFFGKMLATDIETLYIRECLS